MLSTEAARVSWGFAAAISTIIFGLKLYARLKYVGQLKIDDYLQIAAWVTLISILSLAWRMLDLGLQAPAIKYIFYKPSTLTELLKLFFIANQMYIFGILFNKLSLIYLYKGVCAKSITLGKLNHFLTGVAAFSVVFSVILFGLNFTFCTPITAFWSYVPIPQNPAHCPPRRYRLLIYIWQGFNVLSDCLIMGFPYFLVSRAALPVTQRLALYFVFALGGLVIVSSIVKIVAIARALDPEVLVLWSVIEGVVATIVTSLPSLPPLIWRRREQSKKSWKSSQSSEGAQNGFQMMPRDRTAQNYLDIEARYQNPSGRTAEIDGDREGIYPAQVSSGNRQL